MIARPRFFKKPLPRHWVWLLMLVGIGAIAGGMRAIFFDDPQAATTYTHSAVERGNIENLVTATGILQPKDYVDVGAQVSGQLKKLYVDIGSQVKAGDLLAEIDPTVYRAKVDAIRAQLLNQQAQLRDKKAQLALAEIQLNRQKNLQKDDATTKESLQTAEAGLASAIAQQDMLNAQIQQTQSSLRAEEANLAYAKIYSPIDGTVVSITSRQGQTLNANQQAPTIMRVADLTTMTVQAQVSEADISKLRTGMDVYFTTLGGQNNRWESKLDQIQPTPEVTNNVVLYNALFDVPNADGRLMTQMSAQVFFVVAQARDALLIPASAINFVIKNGTGGEGQPVDNRKERKGETASDRASNNKAGSDKGESAIESADGKSPVNSAEGEVEKTSRTGERGSGNRRRGFVQVVKADGSIERRPVKLGVSNRVQVQVLEGLEAGEQVISGSRTAAKKVSTANARPATPGPGMGGGGFR